MLDILFGQTGRRCDGVSRRDFLRVGAVGGIGLAGLLSSEADRGRAARTRRGRSRSSWCISAADCRTTTASTPSPTRRPRCAASTSPSPPASPGCTSPRMLPRMAKVMNKIALVRSGAHNNDHHETATNWVMSGRFGSAFGDFPAMGAVVAHEIGLPRPVAALRRRAAQPVVHLGAGQERLPGRPLSSRSRPATPTRPTSRSRTSAPSSRLTAKRGRPPAKRCWPPSTAWPARSRATTRSRPTTSSTSGPTAMILSKRGARRLRHRAGERPPSRPLRPEHVRPVVPAGPAAGRARRAVRHGQLRRLGPSRPRSGTG